MNANFLVASEASIDINDRLISTSNRYIKLFLACGSKVPLVVPVSDWKSCIFGLARQKK